MTARFSEIAAHGSAQNGANNRKGDKALVLEAFDTLFNKPDYKAAECYWSSN
jgi:hypothetical protein